MIEAYDTLRSPVRCELPKIKGSRFIADAAPAESPIESMAMVERAVRELHDASHHVFAYRLGAGGEVVRTSDAGEPSGSAGRPILREIEARSLTFTVVVVTRYFGGTKLGVGGLARAYAAAASEVLSRAEIRTVRLTKRVVVEHAYELSGVVAGVLAGFELAPAASSYGETVRLEIDVPIVLVDTLIERLTDRSAGRVRACTS